LHALQEALKQIWVLVKQSSQKRPVVIRRFNLAQGFGNEPPQVVCDTVVVENLPYISTKHLSIPRPQVKEKAPDGRSDEWERRMTLNEIVE